jgi:hypothetical protein
MKRVLVALIAGAVLSGVAAAYASSVRVVTKPASATDRAA